MTKKSTIHLLVLPFAIGMVLGITAKLVDTPEITATLPIFDDIMGRFGIWVWAAALISVLSPSALWAAARAMVFFVGMLSAYYAYTVFILHFFPGSQMILWGAIAMLTPFCGFLIWHIHKPNNYANIIACLPFIILFTECYLTAFINPHWALWDKFWLFAVYSGFAVSLSATVPTNSKRFFALLYGLLASIILIILIQAEVIVNPYELLNI